MKSYRIAVVGATGAVGTEMLKTLETSKINIEAVIPMASVRSANKTVEFKGEKLPIRVAGEGAFKDIDIALFSAGGGTSKMLAPIAAADGRLGHRQQQRLADGSGGALGGAGSQSLGCQETQQGHYRQSQLFDHSNGRRPETTAQPI